MRPAHGHYPLRSKLISTPRNARVISVLAPKLFPPTSSKPTHRSSQSYGHSSLLAGTLTIERPGKVPQTPKMSMVSTKRPPHPTPRNGQHLSPGAQRRATPKGDLKSFTKPTAPRLATPRSSSVHKRANSLPSPNDPLKSIDLSISSTRKTTANLKRTKYPPPVKSFAHASHVGFSPGNPQKVNQDNFIAVAGFSAHPKAYLFGVCDGHGMFGKEVSMYSKQRLPALLGLDSALLTTPKNSLTYSIIQVNEELTNSSLDINFSGTTLITVLISGNSLWCANVGDSRAVLARQTDDETAERTGHRGKSWMSMPLSRDHKPDAEDEAIRILSCGGRIASYQDEEGKPLGPARVWLKDQDIPGLAMSRSIGDLVASSAGVICIPEILELTLEPEDKFIVIGSDGLFEFISNEEVVRIVVPFWGKNDPQGACAALESEAHLRWTQVFPTQEEEVIDDITSVVVFLEVA